jgi:hypothetical protein
MLCDADNGDNERTSIPNKNGVIRSSNTDRDKSEVSRYRGDGEEIASDYFQKINKRRE